MGMNTFWRRTIKNELYSQRCPAIDTEAENGIIKAEANIPEKRNRLWIEEGQPPPLPF